MRYVKLVSRRRAIIARPLLKGTSDKLTGVDVSLRCSLAMMRPSPGSAVVRNMNSKSQETVALPDLTLYFLSLIKGF